MVFKYRLDDRLPLSELILFGLQWLAVSIPSIVIIGKVVASIQWHSPADQVIYIQKLIFVTGGTLLVQIVWGHRLPLIVGPATVLLIGIIASRQFPIHAVYGSAVVGGILFTVAGVSGLFSYVRRLFTPKVVAVVLLLIAFTLLPTVMAMISGARSGVPPLMSLIFAFAMILGMFLLQEYAKGLWKSTLIMWVMIAASLLFTLLFPQSREGMPPIRGEAFSVGFFRNLTTDFSIEPGVLISFFFCFIALAVNDLGSMESMEGLLSPPDMGKRVTRGMSITGIANVVGPVNYSISPGVIMASGCASRFALIPAAVILLAVSFSPFVVALAGGVPAVVIGSVLVYVLCFQVAAGLSAAVKCGEEFQMETGLIIALPTLLGTVVSFLPPSIISSFPLFLRPIMGNGFVTGVVLVLTLEHWVFRK